MLIDASRSEAEAGTIEVIGRMSILAGPKREQGFESRNGSSEGFPPGGVVEQPA